MYDFHFLGDRIPFSVGSSVKFQNWFSLRPFGFLAQRPERSGATLSAAGPEKLPWRDGSHVAPISSFIKIRIYLPIVILQ